MLMSGFSLYCLNLMTNYEHDGGLPMITDGVLPNHDVVADGLAEVDGAVVVSF